MRLTETFTWKDDENINHGMTQIYHAKIDITTFAGTYEWWWNDGLTAEGEISIISCD
jgi:hypothetical protein